MNLLDGNKAVITEIERFAVNDGPGIRTLVFIKGCPLHCLWCCNPETRGRAPQLAYTRAKCLDCGNCVAVCEVEALKRTELGVEIDRKKCTVCGLCSAQCPAEALVVIGESMSPEEVFEEINKDFVFYKSSGGGVTLSGGEPLASPKFAHALLSLCKQAGIHTAVETCGHAPWKSFKLVLPVLDTVLFDLKHPDEKRHVQGTGGSNKKILDNLLRLDREEKEIIIRIPLIPGFNDSEQDLTETLFFVSQLKHVTKVDLLPYHKLGRPKYEKIGIKYRIDDLMTHEREKVLSLKKVVENFGYKVTIGG